MKMTNGRHKNDESLDEMNKRVSKTENFEKLTETFRKRKGNKNMDHQNFVLFLFRFFKFQDRSGP